MSDHGNRRRSARPASEEDPFAVVHGLYWLTAANNDGKGPYLMKRIIFAATAVSGLMLVSCSGHGKPSAASYTSVQRVVAAMSRGGLRCTGVSTSSSPVVASAISEASCNFGATMNLIDVFPGRVAAETVRVNAVSTGSQQIWVVYGPDWWVQTDHAHVKHVQQILGGKIIPGPWDQNNSGNVIDPIVVSCTGTAQALVATLVSDQESQNRTLEENWVGVADGSLTSQGQDLQDAVNQWAGAGGNQFSQDAVTLSSDAQRFLTDQGQGLYPGWTGEYHTIKQDIAMLAADCNIPYR